MQYESLRSQALCRQEGFSERLLGLTLFIRQGMLAWLQACQRCIPQSVKPDKPSQTPLLACDITAEMIKVLANITLFNLEGTQS